MRGFVETFLCLCETGEDWAPLMVPLWLSFVVHIGFPKVMLKAVFLSTIELTVSHNDNSEVHSFPAEQGDCGHLAVSRFNKLSRSLLLCQSSTVNHLCWQTHRCLHHLPALHSIYFFCSLSESALLWCTFCDITNPLCSRLSYVVPFSHSDYVYRNAGSQAGTMLSHHYISTSFQCLLVSRNLSAASFSGVFTCQRQNLPSSYHILS